MERWLNIQGWALLGLALCASGWQTGNAAALSLVPVRIALTAKQPISAITVRNDGDEPTVVQLEVAHWSQTDGKDVYATTAEILATPPIFTVPPGGSQLVRIGLRRAPDTQHELTYRVFLQEVPPPPTSEFKGLRVALRFGVPVFVAATTATAKREIAPVAALQWRARVVPGAGRITLTATNMAAAHVQVTRFCLTPRNDPKPLAQRNAPEYVFPGQHRDWSIELTPAPVAGASLHVSAETDAGPFEADVVVEAP
jgi:fimbrial chaperone protein